MKYLAFLILPACFVSTTIAAEEENVTPANELAALMANQPRISATIDKLVEMAMKHPMAADMDDAQKRKLLAEADSLQKNLTSMIPWDQIRSAVATEFAARFTEEELDDILAFYKKGAGKKLLELQPELMAGITSRILETATEEKITLMAAKNLTQLESSIGEKKRLAIFKAKAAEPFPAELLMGRWYGIDTTDPEFKSYWTYEKKSDGSQVISGLDLYPEEKTYEKYKTPGRFTIIGRLVVETDLEDPSFSNVFLIDDVTEEKLTYRIVDEELPIDEWLPLVDQRKKIEPFEIPEGFTETEESTGDE